jgi:hypothetical protein
VIRNAYTPEIREQRSEIRDQRSEIRDQRSKIKEQGTAPRRGGNFLPVAALAGG